VGVAADCLLACSVVRFCIGRQRGHKLAVSSVQCRRRVGREKVRRRDGTRAVTRPIANVCVEGCRALVQARARSLDKPRCEGILVSDGVVCSHMRAVKLTGGVVVVDTQA
jgi:hypothetical protein